MKKSFLPYMLLFYLASICGFIWEIIIRYILGGIKESPLEVLLYYRGVLKGPWAPIYGCGVLLLALIWLAFKNNKLHVIVASIISCGVLEYITGYVLETLFHKRFWDYTGYFLNIQGRICFVSVFGFGIVGALLAMILMPRYLKLFEKETSITTWVMSVILTLLFVADCIFSITGLMCME